MVVLLVQNEVGYKNLCSLVTLGFTEGMYYFPRIDREILSKYSEGLICTTACLRGEVNDHLLKGDYQSAQETVSFYKDLFPGRFYIELNNMLKDVEDPVVEMALHVVIAYCSVPGTYMEGAYDSGNDS